MKRKMIYISGKITGDADYAVKFALAEQKLREAGYRTVNPAALIAPETEWAEAMKIDLRKMLLCDGVALLTGWSTSKGAKIETALALELDIPVNTVDVWLERARK